jgi:hypothetical protein
VLLLSIVGIILSLKAMELQEFFVNRFVLQGHLFWGSINNIGTADFSYQISNYFDAFFKLERFKTNENYGLGYLMFLISGPVVYGYFEKGIRFTNGMPAIFIINFGIFWSLLLYGFLFYLYVSFMKIYIKVLLQSNVLLFLFCAKIESVLRDIVVMGEIGLLNFKFLLLVAAFIIMKYVMMDNPNIMNKLIRKNTLQTAL